MTYLIKRIPNVLTLLRIVLTIALNIYIVVNPHSLLIAILVSILIFLTDFFDGKIARAVNGMSNIGALLDVTADLFYIVISYSILYTLNIVPLWFLFIIIIKFIEFVVTSYFMEAISNRKSIFVFDFLGRLTAVIFYIIPMFSYVVFQLLHNWYINIINLLLFSTALLAFCSFSYRILICIYGMKNINSENSVRQS